MVLHQIAARPLRRAGAFRLALLGALLFNLSSAWAFAFLANLPVGLPIVDDAARVSMSAAIAIDFMLVTLFALHHSVMARPGAKAALARWLDPSFERPLYVMGAALALMTIMWFWQPVPVPLWMIDTAPLRWAVWAVYGLGWLLVVGALFAIDPWEFLGFRQALAAWRGTAASAPRFQTPWLYRLVRHPMQLGLLLAFWATPDMTVGRLVFAGAMTVYLLIGLGFEERALVRAHGDVYRDYQRRVPMLLPFARFRQPSRRTQAG
jgi:protein-S-isoprenylcysteine O-methyltransferase Ste14